MCYFVKQGCREKKVQFKKYVECPCTEIHGLQVAFNRKYMPDNLQLKGFSCKQTKTKLCLFCTVYIQSLQSQSLEWHRTLAKDVSRQRHGYRSYNYCSITQCPDLKPAQDMCPTFPVCLHWKLYNRNANVNTSNQTVVQLFKWTWINFAISLVFEYLFDFYKSQRVGSIKLLKEQWVVYSGI